MFWFLSLPLTLDAVEAGYFIVSRGLGIAAMLGERCR